MQKQGRERKQTIADFLAKARKRKKNHVVYLVEKQNLERG